MENGHEVNASTMSGSLVMPLDPSEHSRSPQDLMTRRLKNRERQRRYRARKHLEADMKKASILNQSTPPQVQLQLPGPPNSCVTRVHCLKDWKKDARRAHLYREEVNQSTNTIPLNTISVTGDQMPYLPSGLNPQLPVESEIQSKNSSVPDNNETPRNTLSRRNWKAEARNKKPDVSSIAEAWGNIFRYKVRASLHDYANGKFIQEYH